MTLAIQSQASLMKKSAHEMFNRMDEAEDVSQIIAQFYQKAYQQVAGSMKGIYRKVATDAGLTDKQATKIISKMKDPTDINSLKRELRKLGTNKAQKVLEQIDSPEYRSRMKLLDGLQKKVDDINHDLYDHDLTTQTRWYRDLASDTYYHTVFDVQKEAGFQFSFKHLDSKMINRALNADWYGQTYKGTLRDNITGLTADIKQQLITGMITGKTERQMASELAEKYQFGAFESRRIVRTESCYVSNEMQFESYKQCGAEQYMYVATLDSKTDEECGALDRKVFDIKEKTPGLNAPPMHPFCRCTTKIYIDQDTRDDMKRRARNPKTGKNEIVPANMSYNEWAKQNGITPKKKSVGDTSAVKPIDDKTNLEATRARIDDWSKKAVDAGAMSEDVRNKFVDGVMKDEDLRKMADTFGAPTNGYRLSGSDPTKQKGSYYSPSEQKIQLETPKSQLRPLERTTAHEHGHWWDNLMSSITGEVRYKGLTFAEHDALHGRIIQRVKNQSLLDAYFPKSASMSDQFLSAVRKDRESLLKKWKDIDFRTQVCLRSKHAGIQDFIDGIGAPDKKYYLRWGHGDKYYNSNYTRLRMSSDEAGSIYSELGMNVRSPKKEFRIYDTASELWANMTDTIFTNDPDEMKLLKECLPETYKAYRKIIGGV